MQLWEQTFDAGDGVNVCVEGFSRHIKREGEYLLQMAAQGDKLGILEKVQGIGSTAAPAWKNRHDSCCPDRHAYIAAPEIGRTFSYSEPLLYPYAMVVSLCLLAASHPSYLPLCCCVRPRATPD